MEKKLIQYYEDNPTTHCPNGHEFTEENTYITTRGHKYCKECRKQNQIEYRNSFSEEKWKQINDSRKMTKKKNPERTKIMAKNQKLKAAYGIGLKEYNEMFETQNGCCAICDTHQSELTKSLAVDHNHDTGEIRSLLCSKCNTGIGLLGDNIELIEKAADYLKKHNQKALTKDISLN